MTDREFDSRMAAVLESFGIPTDRLTDADFDVGQGGLFLEATFFIEFDELNSEQKTVLHEVPGLDHLQ